MSTESLSVQILRRACELAGGERALSRRLHVPCTVLKNWLGEIGTPPSEMLLRAIDVIGEADPIPGTAAPPSVGAPADSAKIPDPQA
jgi:hypothetical protein